MGSKILPLLLFILGLVSNTQCWQHASDAVLLPTIKGRTKPLLVTYVFSAKGPSQDFEPHWTTVEDAVQKQQLDIDIMSIDCSTSPATCLALDVKAYPAIRFYQPDGSILRYRGPRKSGPILSFLRRALRPVITDLTTPESLAQFTTTSGDIVFTASFTSTEAPLYAEHYRHLAKRYHDRYSFGLITHQPHTNLEAQESEPSSTIRCYNNINTETFTLTSADLPLANSLTELLTQCTAPLIYEPTGRRQLAELATLSSSHAKTGLIVHFFTKSTSSSSSSSPSLPKLMSARQIDRIKADYKSEILPFAKKYTTEILFTIIDGDEHPGMDPTVGGLPSDVDFGVSIENVQTGELFPYLRSKILADELEDFLGDVVKGKVKAWDGQSVLHFENESGDGEGAAGRGHDEL